MALQDSSSKILHNNHIYIINVVVACFLTCQLLRSLLWLSYVVLRTWQLKRVWKRRRAMSVTIFLIEIVAQMVRAANKETLFLYLHRQRTGLLLYLHRQCTEITGALVAPICIPFCFWEKKGYNVGAASDTVPCGQQHLRRTKKAALS